MPAPQRSRNSMIGSMLLSPKSLSCWDGRGSRHEGPAVPLTAALPSASACSPDSIPYMEGLIRMTDPRNRVVFFRITEGEYEKLREVLSHDGARSLSDFMRNELLDYIHSGTTSERLYRRLDALEQQIQELKSTTVSLL